MTPQGVITDLWHEALLAHDEYEFDIALSKLQSALQENWDYLESVSADYLLSLPPAIRKRVNRLHEAVAA